MDRNSRCSGHEELVVYRNGVPFPRQNRKDFACEGETHTYTTTTTLLPPVTYEWSLDGIVPYKPLLGSGPTFSYTFDDKKHKLFLVARSNTSQCGIQVDIDVIGSKCPLCTIKCVTESVFIPAGIPTLLIDDKGHRYSISGGRSFECSPTSNANTLVKEAIIQAIKNAAKCATESLQVSIQYNFSSPLCMNLTIKNSPIKFTQIVFGNTTYNFYTGSC